MKTILEALLIFGLIFILWIRIGAAIAETRDRRRAHRAAAAAAEWRRLHDRGART
jgi:hypothetical protein